MLQITKINIKEISGQSTLKANISVVFNHILEVKDIKLRITEKGDYFIAMPSRKYTDKATNEEKYTDIVFIDYHYKDHLRELIVKKYLQEMDEYTTKEINNYEKIEILEEEIPF